MNIREIIFADYKKQLMCYYKYIFQLRIILTKLNELEKKQKELIIHNLFILLHVSAFIISYKI